MKRIAAPTFAIAILAYAPPTLADGDADYIANAESAAPAAVATKASIIRFGADGKMEELRASSNGYWCMGDDPTTPTNDPMCGDANGMEWIMAFVGQKEPPKDKPGFIYMLQGGSAASNLEPYATKPAEGRDWLIDGPHVMVTNAPGLMAIYPGPENPDNTQPYVMFPNTPYAHMMIPVK